VPDPSRMWTEPVADFEGRLLPVQGKLLEPSRSKPTPPFVIGGVGEQLTLRVVAQYADVWTTHAIRLRRLKSSAQEPDSR